MPEERRQNSVEINGGSYYNQEEWLDNKVALLTIMVLKVMIVTMMMTITKKVMNSSSFLRVLPRTN